jgi:tetratricopeptide (TPR) repeat protein
MKSFTVRLLGLLAVPAFLAAAQAPELGTIRFPTSAAPPAQPSFLTGVKALHNFEFNEAREAFQRAQQADPGFALAYWGEAMSYNHPLWAEQDLGAARTALNRLARTPAGRAQRAPEGKERSLVEAIDVLYGDGDKLARDIAYSGAMQRLYERYPDDHEIACLYALSLLGTVRPGDHGFRRQMLAASIAEGVFRENPNHPAAAHFIIHAFDDPEHAPLGLPAARAYAKIAPAAPHALHMPSHIFVQLGMWNDVVASNKTAYAAAVAQIEQKHLPRGREEFHTLSWLEYGYLQLGKFDDAKACVEMAKKTVAIDPSSRVQEGAASMQARYVIESGRWNEMPLADTGAHESGAEAGAHMNHGYGSNADMLLASGLSAARLGNAPAAARAEAALKAERERIAADPGGEYRARPLAIMEKEVGAAIAMAKRDGAESERLLKEATAIEATLGPPSGPPDPLKPSFEMYGEWLLDANRPKEAAAQFEQALLRMPKRALSLRGLSRAAGRPNDTTDSR